MMAAITPLSARIYFIQKNKKMSLEGIHAETNASQSASSHHPSSYNCLVVGKLVWVLQNHETFMGQIEKGQSAETDGCEIRGG
jgi:hypothetical protein